MAYEENYYKSREEDLNKKFSQHKDQVIQDITNVLQRFYDSQRDLQERFQELNKQKEESLVRKAAEEKAKIDKAVKK